MNVSFSVSSNHYDVLLCRYCTYDEATDVLVPIYTLQHKISCAGECAKKFAAGRMCKAFFPHKSQMARNELSRNYC